MSSRVLSISARPKRFSEMVGVGRIANSIRNQVKTGRIPNAWMFIGESGAGKTTLARILAVSLQCTHQEKFGNPCDDCLKLQSSFDITEINASKVSGVEEIESAISGASYAPRSPSLKRVYLLDEAQRLSTAAQNLLLKPFEDFPDSTVFIICTTEPGKILKTLRRRCMTYTIPPLGIESMQKLVSRLLERVKSRREPEPLAEALLELNVTSAGFVAVAVEKYEQGEDAEAAAQVAFDSAINNLDVCRAVIKGDWNTVKAAIKNATSEDAASLRASVAGYMKTVLLDSDLESKRARLMAECIKELSSGFSYETTVASMVAALYNCCKKMSGQ